MKKLILYSLLLFSALSVSAENFDPAVCPDLTVKIYPGNNGWHVLHVTSPAYMHSAQGYDFVGVAVPGSKDADTALKMVMGIKKSAQLDFLITIPDTAGQRVFLYDPDRNDTSKDFLKVSHCSEGTVCFSMSLEESRRKRLTAIRIDMKKNTAEYVLQPGEKLPVEWNEKGFCIRGMKDGSEDFEFVMPCRPFRGTKGGITSVRRKIGSRFLFFPVYQIFYLDSRKTAGNGNK